MGRPIPGEPNPHFSLSGPIHRAGRLLPTYRWSQLRPSRPRPHALPHARQTPPEARRPRVRPVALGRRRAAAGRRTRPAARARYQALPRSNLLPSASHAPIAPCVSLPYRRPTCPTLFETSLPLLLAPIILRIFHAVRPSRRHAPPACPSQVPARPLAPLAPAHDCSITFTAHRSTVHERRLRCVTRRD